MSKHIGQTHGDFSVCQFFPDGTSEYTRRMVSASEAMNAFKHYISSVGARMGTTVRVLLTDGGDCTNMHWERETGIVYPLDLRGAYKLGVVGQLDFTIKPGIPLRPNAP